MKDRLLQLLSPLIVLALWELLVRTGVLDLRFWASPSEVITRLGQIVASGELGRNTAVTLQRMAIGFVLAAIPAVLLGMAMGVNRALRLFFTPLVSSIYPVPKIALVPLVVLLLGIGDNAKIATVVISVFFMVAVNTAAGVLNIDPKYFDIAKNNGAKSWDMVWTVALPGAMPSILTGVNLSLGFALTVIVGTELLLPQDGLGGMIWNSYRNYDLPTNFAVLVVVALIGWGITLLMEEAERQLIPWRPQTSTVGRPAALPAGQEPRLRHFIRVAWMATRPFSFTASITPVVLGSALAAYDSHWNPWFFILTVIGSVAIHAGTNLINDYYDWKKGTDTAQSLGPNRPLKDGLITINQVFAGALACFGLGSVIGLYLVWMTGPFILIIGVLSVLAGWFYTAGPMAFAYVGLGEVIVFIFMGPVMVLGSYYVMAQETPWRIVALALPIACLVAVILHANNMRDFPEDLRNGKRTLANLLGRRASKVEFWLLTMGAFIVLGVLIALRLSPWLAALAFLELPNAVRLTRTAITHEEPAVLNQVVRASAQVHKRFGWLMIAGIVAAWLARV